MTLCLGLAALCLTPAARAVDTKLVPGDSEVVVCLNVKQMMSSDLFKKYALEHVKSALSAPGAAEAIKATGLDPTKDIETVVIAGRMDVQTSKKAVIFLTGKFDEAKIATATAAAAKDGGYKFETGKVGTTTVHAVTPAGQDTVYMAFPDKTTLVMAPDKAYLVEIAGGKAKKMGDVMKSALAKASGKESVYVSAVVTDSMKELAKANPAVEKLAAKLKYATTSLTVTDGAKLAITVETEDEDTAAGLKLAAGAGIPFLKKSAEDGGAPKFVVELIDKVKVARESKALTVNLDVPADVIDKIIKEVMPK